MHYEPVQNFLGDGGFIQVDLGKDSAQSIHGRLAANGGNIGTHEAVRSLRKIVQIHAFVQRHAPGVNLKDLHAAFCVRNAQLNFTVEPSRTAQCYVQSLGSVGGPDYYHVLPLFQTVHEG
ncbi:MAG: hypothetical protein A4E44_01076 [Methanosaeta sp. PtaB.Bin018]|nr:MAG: hypothetical protein A4E44_01076 [Methanosaeta sp. PtaB.Bin018]